MGFKDVMKNIVGLDDDYDEEEEAITQEEIDAEKAKLSAAKSEPMKVERVKPTPPGDAYKTDKAYESMASSLSRNAVRKNYSMNGSAPFKMLVIEPRSFDECTKLVDNLRSRKPVIINLEKVETDLARKMFDFMSGATYALNGNVQRVTSNIFIFAPANVDIAAKMNRETASDATVSAGYTKDKDAKSPWR